MRRASIFMNLKPLFMKATFSSCLFFLIFASSTVLFVSSCDDEDEPEIQYPETGFYGDNILMKEKTEYTAQGNSLQAKPPGGKRLKIVITGLSATDQTGIWYYHVGTSNNWAITKFDISTYTQVFQSIDGGQTCDLSMLFDVGNFRIDYYENDAVSPTYSKDIVVNY